VALSFRSFGATDVGRRRKHNEDAYRSDDELGLWVVADGVGGQAKGEVASAEAVDQIYSYVKQGLDAIDRSKLGTLRRHLESAVQSACYLLFGIAEVNPSHSGMSTTISALLIDRKGGGRFAVTAQVGDSRIYRVRGGRGDQLTEDHTLINHKLKKGLITPEQAMTMKGKNVITRAVGHKEFVEVDTLEIDVQAGDRFVLCSDGLHGYLQPGEVEELVKLDPLRESAQRFIDVANGRGGRDNITAIVVAVEGVSEASF
jgi:protein phosphatase